MTPLVEAVRAYQARRLSPFHMPGHKGKALFCAGLPWEWDITEVEGVDSLYQAAGPIARAEARYARLYGARASLLSAGGATLCIQAMLRLAVGPGEVVIASRSIHSSAVGAMALLGAVPHWIWPNQAEMDTGLPGVALPVTTGQISAALDRCPGAAAVYLTSPDYFGQLSDIGGAAALCRDRGIPLLVDNAHGAHLAFLPGGSRHPIALGASLSADSLHKTLPVLTGGALLHVGEDRFVPGAKGAMALFGSTSPSYPIMLSADGALDYVENDLPRLLPPVLDQVAALGELAARQGFAQPLGRDPMRLTIGYAPLGWRDGEFGAYLRQKGIEPEFLGGGVCVLMASPQNSREDFCRLERALADCGPKGPSLEPGGLLPPTQARLTLREALFAPSQVIPVEEAVGRTAAAVCSACPPGIPVAVPGEILTQAAVCLLKNSGVPAVSVVK